MRMKIIYFSNIRDWFCIWHYGCQNDFKLNLEFYLRGLFWSFNICEGVTSGITGKRGRLEKRASCKQQRTTKL